MDAETRALKAQLEKLSSGRSALSRRYSEPVRSRIIALARRRLAQGDTRSRIATELGITFKTLHEWLESTSARPSLKAVRVTARSAPSAPVLVTSRGVRVEGLDLQATIEILRALS